MKLRHDWEQVFFCNRQYCYDYFSTEEELSGHIESHPMQTIWSIRKGGHEKRCWECDEIFPTKNDLKEHFGAVHHQSSSTAVPADDGEDEGCSLYCQVCRSTFTSSQALSRHECYKATSVTKKIRLTPVCYEETSEVYGVSSSNNS